MNVYKQGDKLNNACIEKMLLCEVSVSQICKTACKLRYCVDKDKKSLLNGKISPTELRDKAFISSEGKQISFDDIYSSMKDTTIESKVCLSDTANLFDFGVNSLEDIIEKILSDKYISTFDESDKESKEIISNDCNRLEKIIKVITSLL